MRPEWAQCNQWKSNVTEYTYNADGSLATKTYRNGNQLTMTDSTGTTTRTYDEKNRVLTKNVPNLGTTIFQYDTITGIETGCYAETTTDPKGNVTQKVFDSVGRLKTVTADAKTTTYNYLENGARQNVIYSDGARGDYTYYKDGLLWTLTISSLAQLAPGDDP